MKTVTSRTPGYRVVGNPGTLDAHFEFHTRCHLEPRILKQNHNSIIVFLHHSASPQPLLTICSFMP